MNITTINKAMLTRPEICAALKADIKEKTKKGQFFTVHFIKANGQPRRITGRLLVKKYLKTPDGTGRAPDKDNRITIWDSASYGYRTIPIDRLTGLKIAGKVIEFK